MTHRVKSVTQLYLATAKRLSIIMLCFVTVVIAPLALAQTWTPVVNPFGVPAGTALLLTDGSVMVQQMSSTGHGTGRWWQMIPDSAGNYANPTWNLITAMPTGWGPLYYASAVLPDGRVAIVGGEYNLESGVVDTNIGAIYNPTTRAWTTLSAPDGFLQIGDASSVVLPNGTFMIGGCCSATSHLLNTSSLIWTPTVSGKADSNGEEGWTLLPSGKVLTIDTSIPTNAELYDPSTGSWSTTGNTGVSLVSGGEIGPAVLRPDGTVFATGANSNTAIYNTTTGTWSIGPSFPNGLGVPDGPAALLPNGRVLVDAGWTSMAPGSWFYEFDGTNLTWVGSGPSNAPNDPSFVGRMLVLPTGQVLFTDQSTHLAVYTPSGTFQSSWRPVITSVATDLNSGSLNNPISGLQFNGLSQGAKYGDDAQSATNYPLVRITNNATGHVIYAKTHNHSTMGVATGAAVVSTQFDIPSGIEGGASTLQVVANGIPSTAVNITVHSPATGIVGFAGTISCIQDGTQFCDYGTIAVTVNTTTKTIDYDGTGIYTGTGYGFSGAPGMPVTIAQTIANAFNGDPNSPVIANFIADGNGGDVQFVAKINGSGGNYPISLNVTSFLGDFQYFGQSFDPFVWTLTPSRFCCQVGIDPNTLTEITPLSGSMTGGH